MKRLILIIIVLALVAVGAILIFRPFENLRQQAAAPVAYETVALETGSLVSTVSATGSVRSKQTVSLNWQTSGLVKDVNFRTGERVQAGDVLAELEQTSLSQSIIMVRADLVNAQKALDELHTSAETARVNAMQSIVRYAKEVKDAQYQLDNFTVPASQADMTAIEALDLMKVQLDEARAAFEPYKFYPASDTKRQELLEALNKAQSEYNTAVKRLDYEYELEVAKANLEKARQDYEKWKDGPGTDDLAAAQARIDAAEATLSQAWIETPINGIITQAHPAAGDLVSPNTPAFRIDDLDTLYVDLEVSEVDITLVSPGQEVLISFDAIHGKEYHGKVDAIASVGGSSQGVVSFTVTVEVVDKDDAVRPGMTASADIIVAERKAALLVPNTSIRLVDGEQVVYVQKNGKAVPVAVILGASSETHSEVLSGKLQVGDLVLVNPADALATPDPEMQFFMGRGAGGGGERQNPGVHP